VIRLGLTGGIGSGKSTVAKIFQGFGVPVYDSDSRAKWLMNNKHELVEGIQQLFGKEAYLNGKLNRKHIAAVAFEDKSLLGQLNELVHPAVGKDFEDWCNFQLSRFIIKEAAILIESGAYKSCDKIIVINAPVDVRIQRVVERDNCDPNDVLKRMQHQYTDEQRSQHADYIINNYGKEHLIHQVRVIMQDLEHQFPL